MKFSFNEDEVLERLDYAEEDHIRKAVAIIMASSICSIYYVPGISFYVLHMYASQQSYKVGI